MPTVKESVLRVVEILPDDCTWDDLLYHLYVRRQIEAGLDEVDRGEVTSHEKVFAEYDTQP